MIISRVISASLSLLLASTLSAPSQAEPTNTQKIRAILIIEPTQAERDAALTAWATAQTKLLDKVRPDWGPNDKRWSAIFERVKSDLAVVLAQENSRAEVALQTHLSNVAAEMTSSDIDAMLTFYKSEAGRRYQMCAARLDLIASQAPLSLFDKNRPVERATPEEFKQFVRLLQISHVIQTDIAKQEEDRAAGRDISGYAALPFMLAGTINRHRSALMQLNERCSPGLEEFEKFNKSDATRRFFVALMHAEKKKVRLRGKGAFTGLLDSLKPKQLEWKALYSSSAAP